MRSEISISESAKQAIVVLRHKGLSRTEILDFLVSISLLQYFSQYDYKNNTCKTASIAAEKLDDLLKLTDKDLPVWLGLTLVDWEQFNKENFKNLLAIPQPLLDMIGGRTIRDILAGIKNSPVSLSNENGIEFFSVLEKELLTNTPDAHINYTPSEIIALLTKTIQSDETYKPETIYDPFCRNGDLLVKAAISNTAVKSITGIAANKIFRKLTMARIILMQLPEAHIVRGNIDSAVFAEEKFDYIISNPPFGGKPEKMFIPKNMTWANKYAGTRTELDFICHIIDHLSEKGRAAVVVPMGILFGAGKLREFRKDLVMSNYAEAIISLPPRIFYQTGVTTAILILNKAKTSDTTLLIDAAAMGIQQSNMRLLLQTETALLTEIVKDFREKGHDHVDSKMAITIDRARFEENEYSFQYSTYTASQSTLCPAKIEPSFELEQEIKELWSELNHCNDLIAAHIQSNPKYS